MLWYLKIISIVDITVLHCVIKVIWSLMRVISAWWRNDLASSILPIWFYLKNITFCKRAQNDNGIKLHWNVKPLSVAWILQRVIHLMWFILLILMDVVPLYSNLKFNGHFSFLPLSYSPLYMYLAVHNTTPCQCPHPMPHVKRVPWPTLQGCDDVILHQIRRGMLPEGCLGYCFRCIENCILNWEFLHS